MHPFLAAALLIFLMKNAAFGQSVRRSPSGDVHVLNELKKGQNLGLPFQVYPFTHSHFGFSNGIAKDPDGFLWVGRRFGVQRFNGYDWQFFDMPFDTCVFKEMLGGKPLDALGGNEQWMFNQLHGVEDVRVGPDGQVWATAQGELFRFEKAAQRFEKFLSRSFFKEKGVAATEFFKAKPEGDSLLWIYGNKPGLYRFHLKTGRLDDFSKGSSTNFWEPADSCLPDHVPDWAFDQKGTLWAPGNDPVSNSRFRLNSLDPATGRWSRHAFPGRMVDWTRTDWFMANDILMWDFCLDPADSLVWMGGGEVGLLHFHKKTQRWQQFYLDLEAGAGAETVRDVGDLEPWADSLILLNGGDWLLAFDKKKEAFFRIDSAGGLPIRQPIRLFTDLSGDVFITSLFGILALENPKKAAIQPAVWFSKIRAGGVDRITQPTQNVAPFSLFEGEKTVEIEFFGLPFRMPNLLEYRYRTSEFGSKWLEIGSKRSIRVGGLVGDSRVEVSARLPGGAWSEPSVLRFVVVIPFWKRGWFQAVAAAVLGGFFYGFFWLNRRRARRDSAFRQQLAEAEMASIRAQISPAFLFNCLASIDHFLKKNEPQKASAYLTKFSRLVRQILDNARSREAFLSDEIAALELFLQLEAMRFDRRLSYRFSVDPGLETAETRVEPRAIQLFVEQHLPSEKGAAEVEILIEKASGERLRLVVKTAEKSFETALEMQAEMV